MIARFAATLAAVIAKLFPVGFYTAFVNYLLIAAAFTMNWVFLSFDSINLNGQAEREKAAVLMTFQFILWFPPFSCIIFCIVFTFCSPCDDASKKRYRIGLTLLAVAFAGLFPIIAGYLVLKRVQAMTWEDFVMGCGCDEHEAEKLAAEARRIGIATVTLDFVTSVFSIAYVIATGVQGCVIYHSANPPLGLQSADELIQATK